MELKKNTLPSPLHKKCKRHLILLILSLMIFSFVANIYAALCLTNPETHVLNVPFGIHAFIFIVILVYFLPLSVNLYRMSKAAEMKKTKIFAAIMVIYFSISVVLFVMFMIYFAISALI